jgi:mRNA interferase YafQ
MYEIRATKQFGKDLKKAQKRNKNLNKLWNIVELLSKNKPLQDKYCKHKLVGFKEEDIFECHIEPNWLLIWQIEDNELILIRTGTHSDLF